MWPGCSRRFHSPRAPLPACAALLWLFTVLALERLVARFPARRILIVIVAALLALPTTGEFTTRRIATPPDRLPARVLEAMARLSEDSRPGDRVLMRPLSRYPPAPMVLVGRRVPFSLFFGYLRQFAPGAVVRSQAELVRAFLHAENPEVARRTARRLRVGHVYLEGSKGVGPGADAILAPIYIKKDRALYRVRRADLVATRTPLRR